jgi:hypothetical protein
MNDQMNDVVESRKNERNDEVKSSQNDVDESRASSNSSSSESSFNEFFNLEEKEIASLATSHRRVVFESIFNSKSSFNFRRNSRRSSQTLFKKKNDWFLTKTITSNRRSNVVVVQNFNEFFLFYFIDKIK